MFILVNGSGCQMASWNSLTPDMLCGETSACCHSPQDLTDLHLQPTSHLHRAESRHRAEVAFCSPLFVRQQPLKSVTTLWMRCHRPTHNADKNNCLNIQQNRGRHRLRVSIYMATLCIQVGPFGCHVVIRRDAPCNSNPDEKYTFVEQWLKLHVNSICF